MGIFRLYLPGGEDIGSFETSETDWLIGDEFQNVDRVRFREVDVIEGEDLGGSKFVGCLVLTPTELPSSDARRESRLWRHRTLLGRVCAAPPACRK